MIIRAIIGFTLFTAILLGIFEIAARQKGGSISAVLQEVAVAYGVTVVFITALGLIGRGKQK